MMDLATDTDYPCFYRTITRQHFERQNTKNDDYEYELGDKIKFEDDILLPRGTEFIYVECGIERCNGWSALHKDAHAMVTEYKESVKSLPHLHNDGDKPSVLIVGLKSMFRMNFMRKMPNTREFLHKDGFDELRGYSTIGEDSFPNLMAFLTGMSMDEMRRANCARNWSLPMDNCDFIWKEYKANGYATAFIEDTADLTTFNYQKYGFTNQPTDYYFHHFMVASEQMLPSTFREGVIQCLGPKHVSQQIYDYCLQFAKEFHDKRAFGVFWSNPTSELNLPATKDIETKDFLKKLKRTIDDSTILIVMSDHGMRTGPLSETWIGWLEERLPFFYVKFPPSFKERYPNAYKAFQANRNRLTSPYDLHLTLRHILDGIDKAVSKDGTASCEDCVSLFHEVPVNRSYKHAGIPAQWCACSTGTDVSSPYLEEIKRSVAQFVVDEANDILKNASKNVLPGTSCASLSLRKIINFRSIIEPGRGYQTKERYMIFLETKPNRAIFETSVLSYRETPLDYKLFSNIDTLNMYGSQCYCIEDSFFKHDCFFETSLVNYNLIPPYNYSRISNIGRMNMYGSLCYCIEDSFFKHYCFCIKNSS